MDYEYLMFNAPSARTIDRAAELGCNWAIVHSMGNDRTHPGVEADEDLFPIYFEDYPKVAEARRRCRHWLEPMRREVTDLCDRAAGRGLKAAFHVYEPYLPPDFQREYPDLVGTWCRPTQSGVVEVPTRLDPDDPRTWRLLRDKYAELAREFPRLGMVILSTWDGSGAPLCVPEARMPVHERLVKMVAAAREGVRSVRDDVVVCFRLWGRNWPRAVYLDGHRLIAEITGVADASDLMEQVARSANDPDEVLPKVLAALPADVPIMYKSTRIDIAEAQPLTSVLGDYPPARRQILEVSYEWYHRKPWPWCKVAHIRKGLAAAAGAALAGVLALPIPMGRNDRSGDPEAGNLGRMNTWLLERLLAGDGRTDAELVGAWLAEEFGSPQPAAAVEVLLDADGLVDEGIQWGGGVPARAPFASLHATKLYWMFDGFIDPDFPHAMAEPTRETLERMMDRKGRAHARARAAVEKVHAARADMHPDLADELAAGLGDLADAIGLCRHWHCRLLMQYGIERKVFPADRVNLGRMARHAETFIRDLERLRDTDAGRWALSRLSFPDPFALT